MEKFLDIIKHPITISIIILTVGIIGIWGIISIIPKSNIEPAKKVERSWGKQDSKVVVTVYKDLQCPGCKFFWENVEPELKAKYEDKIKLVYHHYPLAIHIKADNAAQAAEAAGEQGKFFEYVTLLYKEQPDQSNLASWTDSRLIELAKQINGLDIARFEESFKSGKYKSVIDQYIKEAEAKGISSTPTVLINDKEVRGPANSAGQSTIADFNTIEAEIKKILGDIKPSTTPISTPTAQITR